MLWRYTLLGVFVLLVFEGALRKWAFPWAEAQIYFIKDIVLLACYISFILNYRTKRDRAEGVTLIRSILILNVVFGCIEVFNPNSPSILIGLMGLKAYFLYAPVAFVLPYAFDSQQQFMKMIRGYLFISVPVALLSFVQVAAGPESVLNAYVSHSEDPTGPVRFGADNDIVRTAGTFSYIAGYTTFLSFIAFIAVGHSLAKGWHLRENLMPIVVLIVVVGAMFTTGSRAPVYALVIAAPIIIILALKCRILAFRIAVRLCVVTPIIAVLALNISPRATDGFMDRAGEGGTSYALARMMSPVFETGEALTNAPEFGIGIGTTHPSALTIMGVEWPWWMEGMFTEDEMARVTVELGFVGLFLTYLLRVLIAAFTLRAAMSFRDPTHRAFGIVLAVYMGIAMMSSIMLNSTAGLYYWGSLGLILAMRRFERTMRGGGGDFATPGAGEARGINRSDQFALQSKPCPASGGPFLLNGRSNK